jgi:tetratricopeptide (TPR) repeat protein/RNA polymerase subunit RPABC4/transcription elongation factor Spt4
MDLEKFLEAGGTRACPACGETIPAEAVVCPACQTTIVSEASGPEPTMVLCGNCGATVLEGVEVCDTCGEPMRGISGARPGPREKGPVCPSCGAVLEPDATVCEMCGRELGSPAEAAPAVPAGPDEEMQAIERLLEEEPDDLEVAAGLDALANEVEAEEAVLELEGPEPPRKRVKAPAELHLAKFVVPHSVRFSPVARLRETAVAATLATLLPAAYVAAVPSEVGRWAVLALSGSLLATALALAFLEFAPIRERWRDHAIALLGGALLLAVPVHNAARALLPEAADGALLVVGTALAVAGGAPFRRTPAATAPWIAALPAFVAAAASMALGAPAGSLAIVVGTWAAVAIAVGASAILTVRRRWVDGRISRSVARAQDLAVDRNYKGAIEELDRAIDLAGETGSEAPWYSKGAALVVLGRYEEALACIDTALRMNPRNEVAWVNKGNALVRMGRVVDALKCYNSAIKVNPGYEVGWNNKGNALARLGKYGDALRCYEKALEIDAEYKGAWVNKGYVLTKLGDFEAAAKCADEVIRLGGARGVAA